ncbi:MAG: DinB family protein [Flavobacteriales bacterium]
MKITKPPNEANYYDKYLDLITDPDLIAGYKRQSEATLQTLSSLDAGQWNYRYAEGKWNIKQLVLHLLDTERVFTYRALRYSRNDKTALPPYDENWYAENCGDEHRSGASIIEEYAVVRANTITLFINCTEEMLARTGTASGLEMSVAKAGFVILGHEMHHMQVLHERYFPGLGR